MTVPSGGIGLEYCVPKRFINVSGRDFPQVNISFGFFPTAAGQDPSALASVSTRSMTSVTSPPHPLPQGAGYGVIIGLGVFFGLGWW